MNNQLPSYELPDIVFKDVDIHEKWTGLAAHLLAFADHYGEITLSPFQLRMIMMQAITQGMCGGIRSAPAHSWNALSIGPPSTYFSSQKAKRGRPSVDPLKSRDVKRWEAVEATRQWVAENGGVQDLPVLRAVTLLLRSCRNWDGPEGLASRSEVENLFKHVTDEAIAASVSRGARKMADAQAEVEAMRHGLAEKDPD